MKALIFISVWKRPEVTDLTYSGLDRVQSILKEEGIDSEVLVVSSEDYHTENAKKRGYHVIQVENFPVGNKFNLGMIEALKHDWNYLMEMGSNNLLSNLYVRSFAAACKENLAIFGSAKFYALQRDKKHVCIFNVKLPGGFGGVGRGFRRDTLEAIENKIWWGEMKNIRLDSSIWALVVDKQIKKDKQSVRRLVNNSYPSVLDVKSEEDLNQHRGDTEADLDFLTHWFPELKNWLD